jgi:nucleotide-binding universal stress UspA family protein
MAIHEILYPTDFSECGRYAGSYAAMLARTFDASLHILHVPFAGFPLRKGEWADASSGELVRSGLVHAERLLHEAEFRGLQVRTSVMEGLIEEEIWKAAEQADLIVMGTHGRTGLSRIMLGSVAEKVVGTARCPVLVVKHPDIDVELPWGGHLKGARRTPQAPPRFLNILVPLDGSPRSELVLEEAKNLARACEAVIVLFLVISSSPQLGGLPPGEMTPADQTRIVDYLQQKQEALRSEGHMVETVLRSGDAATEILDYADARGIDLIAMSTHGWTGLRRWFLGSVADKVLRASTIPVLLIRAWNEAKGPNESSDLHACVDQSHGTSRPGVAIMPG